jgi:hydrogenase-4 membrane subunit HyfE
MSGGLVWLLVALGLGVVVVRRRSVAVGLVTAQALLLAGSALHAGTASKAVAAAALAIRAVTLAVVLLLVVSRTREPRPVRAGVAPLARGGLAVAFALALTWLVPVIGLDSRNAERGVLALIAFGIVTVATRSATLLQVLGVVLVENGLALAAVELPGAGSSTAIELGVALDLMLVALVAVVFHERIFTEFGAGDSRHLRSLRGPVARRSRSSSSRLRLSPHSSQRLRLGGSCPASPSWALSCRAPRRARSRRSRSRGPLIHSSGDTWSSTRPPGCLWA